MPVQYAQWNCIALYHRVNITMGLLVFQAEPYASIFETLVQQAQGTERHRVLPYEPDAYFCKKSSGHLRSECQVDSTCWAWSKWHKMRLYDNPTITACWDFAEDGAAWLTHLSLCSKSSLFPLLLSNCSRLLSRPLSLIAKDSIRQVVSQLLDLQYRTPSLRRSGIDKKNMGFLVKP